MKTKKIVYSLMLAMSVTACSRQVKLNTKAAVLAPTAEQIASASAKANAAKMAAANDLSVNGKLMPFSKNDFDELNGKLVFANTDDAANAMPGVGNPAFTVAEKNETPRDGFVKKSNLTFRAIQKVPPLAAAIKKVNQLKLVLHGVRLFNDGTTSLADVFSKQVLCVADKQICAGKSLDSSTLNNLWKSVTTEGTDPLDLSMNAFRLKLVMNDGSKVFAYRGIQPLPTQAVSTPSTTNSGSSTSSVAPASSAAQTVVKAPTKSTALTITLPEPPKSAKKRNQVNQNPSTHIASASNAAPALAPAPPAPVSQDLEIDLIKLFHITDVPKWIIENSVAYNTAGNYRKFRFEIGENLYASSGELVLNFDTDSRVPVSVDMNAPVGTPAKGEWDGNIDSDYQPGTAVPEVMVAGLRDVSKKLASDAIGFDLAADGSEKINDASLARIKAFSAILLQDQSSLKEVVVRGIMDKGLDDGVSNAVKAKARASLVLTALKNNQVTLTQAPVETRIQKQSRCTAPTASCLEDQFINIDLVMANPIDTDAATLLRSELKDGFNTSFGLTPNAAETSESAN